jgi:hypothetical protein
MSSDAIPIGDDGFRHPFIEATRRTLASSGGHSAERSACSCGSASRCVRSSALSRPATRSSPISRRRRGRISVLFTIIGNPDDVSLAEPKLEASFDQLANVLELLAEARALGRVGELLARFLSHAIAFGVDAAITIHEPFTGLVKRAAEALPAPPGRLHLLDCVFIFLDSDRTGVQQGEPQAFRDWSWQGLPMDDQAKDALVPTKFTQPARTSGRTGPSASTRTGSPRATSS